MHLFLVSIALALARLAVYQEGTTTELRHTHHHDEMSYGGHGQDVWSPGNNDPHLKGGSPFECTDGNGYACWYNKPGTRDEAGRNRGWPKTCSYQLWFGYCFCAIADESSFRC